MQTLINSFLDLNHTSERPLSQSILSRLPHNYHIGKCVGLTNLKLLNHGILQNQKNLTAWHGALSRN